MERVYHCPICGKTYASLKDMYVCAQACEAKELAKESKIEADRKAAEKRILDKYEALRTEIHNYNVKYAPNSFNLVMKHQGQTLANGGTADKSGDIKSILNYNKPNVNLEAFLKNEIESVRGKKNQRDNSSERFFFERFLEDDFFNSKNPYMK